VGLHTYATTTAAAAVTIFGSCFIFQVGRYPQRSLKNNLWGLLVRRRVGGSHVPWLTPECINIKRKRRRLERRLKRTRAEGDRLAYRRSCREATCVFREARSTYTRDKLQ